MAAMFDVFVDWDQSNSPTLNRLLSLINDHISQVLLLILVHVLLQSCLYF